jgi:extradiol dioxygenase family protein
MDVLEDVGRIVRDGHGQSLERLVNVTDSRAFDGGVAGCSRARRCREITVSVFYEHQCTTMENADTECARSRRWCMGASRVFLNESKA